MKRIYHCPECDGYGSFVKSPSGCGNDPDAVEWECGDCDGSGLTFADPAVDDVAGLRPWSPSTRWSRFMHVRPYDPARDVLVELARCRTTGARGTSVAYFNTKLRAMKPVQFQRSTAQFLTQDIDPILRRYMNGASS